MPTPNDVRYTTPVNVSPRRVSAYHSPAAHPERWTSTSLLSALQSHPGHMTWSGKTCRDIEIKHQEGHSLEDDGEWDEAEGQFREALGGCHVLLSPVHEYTIRFTYHLAEFYAQRDQMDDADVLLNWTTDRMLSRIGVGDEAFIHHLVKITVLLREWSRIEEARRFAVMVVQLVHLTHFEKETKGRKFDPQIPHIKTSRHLLMDARFLRGPHKFLVPLGANSTDLNSHMDDQKLMDAQLGLASTYVKTNEGTIEDYLLNMIEYCEDDKDWLIVQALRARAAVIDLYQRLKSSKKMHTILLQTKEILLNISTTKYQQNTHLPLVTIETAKLYIKCDQENVAREILSKIEADIVDASGPDDRLTVDLLIAIGDWFQEQNKWKDARPRYEQALAATLTKHSLQCHIIKRLESALVDHHHESASKSYCECLESFYTASDACTEWINNSSTGKATVNGCDLMCESS